MKRRPTKPQAIKYRYEVFMTFPLIHWRECACCGKEFRREHGWRFIGGPFHGGQGVWSYLCNECAPTRVEAHSQANALGTGEPKGKRPAPPPAPPARIG